MKPAHLKLKALLAIATLLTLSLPLQATDEQPQEEKEFVEQFFEEAHDLLNRLINAHLGNNIEQKTNDTELLEKLAKHGCEDAVKKMVETVVVTRVASFTGSPLPIKEKAYKKIINSCVDCIKRAGADEFKLKQQENKKA